MKILSDFDGVLTNLTEEAERARQLFDAYLFEIAGEEISRQCIAAAQEKIRQSPHLNGWRSRGRVTAFADEDGFIYVNGLAACLDDQAREPGLAADLLTQLRKIGLDQFSHLAGRAYAAMVRETESGRMKPMDEGAGRVLKELIHRGHSIVVVSNSGTDRIRKILADSDVGEELRKQNGSIRIRGDARKFELGEAAETLLVENYTIPVDRPVYRNIILEERPDVVIGDVLSLDLALPIHLGGATRIFLRRRDYTPSWSLNFMEKRQKGAPGGILEQFDDLLALA
ncbi:MAG: hypothetical protein HYR96_05160 [Deltaproteobacteria bacterium]|nr:hypothetical protein [Deltaproteobacteria bacterium]MBI3295501.1 hypothetical protein [Deltaproteobacteria bacterium]